MLQQVQKEIAIMKKLSHVNCIRMYEVIDDPTSNKLYLRLEFATGGQCMEARNGTAPLPIDVAQRFFTDMILGLEYLHRNHVVHRDIKPENLLVCTETGRLKLADFGVSQVNLSLSHLSTSLSLTRQPLSLSLVNLSLSLTRQPR